MSFINFHISCRIGADDFRNLKTTLNLNGYTRFDFSKKREDLQNYSKIWKAG